jgi:hypothetical protein
MAVSLASTLRIASAMKLGGELPLGLLGFTAESLSPIMAAGFSIIVAPITEVSKTYAEANPDIMLSEQPAIYVKPVR